TGQNSFVTIADLAMQQGLSAGAVSTVMVSHATPAAAIAKNVSRNNYAEIFNEMIESDLSVIMGAGHPLYDGSGRSIQDNDKQDYKYVGGEETFSDMISLTQQNDYQFIDAKTDFAALTTGTDLPDRVVGIARSGSTLQAAREQLGTGNTPSGMAYNADVPDLATMSTGALNVLHQDKDGFFVMIEGGAVDWMGHANNMPRYIEEQVDFNLAVDAVIEWIETNSSWDETLLIITSDHECGGIWGEGTWTNSAGGPVAVDRSSDALNTARFDPSEDEFNEFLAVQDRGKGNLPGYQWSSPNHTNDLVPLWAIGVGAEYFGQFTRTDLKAAELWGEQYSWNGNYVDNTSVFHVMNTVLQDARD
ncbi:MAG: alkaline phosphatase, partial [Pseudomonadota bacterium]